ncbi:MAG: SDR family oxidoreductase, partial [Oscillospiraceae bacterium]
AKELGPDGITVNAILPGRIDTEMLAYATPERRAQWLQSTPLGRFGDTADIAELAVFLASDKGGYITGAKINVNGGLSTG